MNTAKYVKIAMNEQKQFKRKNENNEKKFDEDTDNDTKNTIETKTLVANNDYIEVFTDGSFVKNKNIIKCGYGVYFPNKEYRPIGRKFKYEPLTNNRAELYAILKAIILCNKIKYKRNKNNETDIKTIIIYTDSNYCVNSLTVWHKKWIKNNKDYMNKDLIDLIIDAINTVSFEIKLKHVYAHTGKQDKKSIANDIADKLAKLGSSKK